MAIASYKAASTAYKTTVIAAQKLMPQVADLAQVTAQAGPSQRIGRCTKKEYVMDSQKKFNPKEMIKGHDNSNAFVRWNGCKDFFKFLFPKAALYCSQKSRNGQFSAVAAEMGHYANKGRPNNQSKKDYFEVEKLFPSTSVLLDLWTPDHRCPSGPLMIFDPFAEPTIFELEAIFKGILPQITEQMMCIFMDAPEDEKMMYVSTMMSQELLRIRQGGQKTLSLRSLLGSPSYGVSALVGNACLGEGIAIIAPTARADTVPQQQFLEGSRNLILPVGKDGSTGLRLNGVHQFDVETRRFVFTPADELQ